MGRGRCSRPFLCSPSLDRGWVWGPVPHSWPQPVDGGTAGDTVRLFTRGAQSDPRPPSTWAPCGADPGLVSRGLFWAAVSLASGSSKVIPAERMSYVEASFSTHRACWAQGRAPLRHPSLVWAPRLQTLWILAEPFCPGAGRSEARGQRSSLAEASRTWMRQRDHPFPPLPW